MTNRIQNMGSCCWIIGVLSLCIVLVFSHGAQATLVLHAELNDNAAGTTVVDLIGPDGTSSSNTDTMHIDSGPENLGGALEFNGMSDFINFGDSTQVSYTQRTVSVWIKANRANTGSHRIVYFAGYGAGLGQGDQLAFHSGYELLRYNIKTDAGVISLDLWNDDIPDNKWFLVTYSWDGTNARLYLNGVLQATVALAGSADPTDTHDDIYLGTIYNHTVLYDGALDDLRIYDTALTGSEIQQLYLEFRNLVLHAELNDNTAGPTVADLIGSDGTASNNTDTMHIDSGPGLLGGALEFNGTSDFINFGDSTQAGYTQRTVSVWIKANRANTGSHRCVYFAGYEAGLGYGDQLLFHSGYELLRYSLKTDAGAISLDLWNDDIPDNAWFLVTYSWDGTNARLYRNGVLQSTVALAGSADPADTYDDIYLGAIYNHSSLYDGALDDLRIYRTALSTPEVLEIYKSAFPKGTAMILR